MRRKRVLIPLGVLLAIVVLVAVFSLTGLLLTG